MAQELLSHRLFVRGKRFAWYIERRRPDTCSTLVRSRAAARAENWSER